VEDRAAGRCSGVVVKTVVGCELEGALAPRNPPKMLVGAAEEWGYRAETDCPLRLRLMSKQNRD